jgi:hypothetical protein
MKRLRGKLTYANVMVTLLTFVVLGGGAYAATKLPASSVGTKQLKNGAVTAAKIKNGTISGSKIQVASLGTVPSATTATNADQLGGSAPSSYHDRCPAGTSLASADLCVTGSSIGTSAYFNALEACAAHGWRLPSPAEAEIIFPKTPPTETFWTDDYWNNAPESEALYFSTEDKALFGAPTKDPTSVFCVTAPSNT